MRGLHGAGEVIVALILLACFLIPGILFYIAQEGTPYCTGCSRRVPSGKLAVA